MAVSNIQKYIIFFCLTVLEFGFYTNGGRFTIPHFLLLFTEGLLIANTFCMLLFYFKIKKQYAPYIYSMIVVILMSYFLGIINYHGQAIDIDKNTDLVICFLFISAFFLLKYSHTVFEKYFKCITLLASLVTFYELMNTGFQTIFSVATDRSLLWETGFFFCGSLFWFVQLYLIYSFVYKRSLLFPLIAWFMALLINLIATKRQFLVETVWILILLFSFFIITKQRKSIFQMVKLFAIVLLAVLVIGPIVLDFDITTLFSATTERLDADNVGSTGFVRFEESINYFNSASLSELIVGRGLGIPHYGLGNSNTALHVGIANLVLKFGIFLIIPFLIMVMLVFMQIKRIPYFYKKDPWMVVCLLNAMSALPAFFFLENNWVLTPCGCFFFYSILYVVNNRNKI